MKQAREKLQVACDWFSDPLRIHQEAEGLRWLMKLAPEGDIEDWVVKKPLPALTGK